MKMKKQCEHCKTPLPDDWEGMFCSAECADLDREEMAKWEWFQELDIRG
jgi:predicted nucleic acid-binding Zn ribbon protein